MEQERKWGKAESLYARVEQGKNEKLKGMAFYDQASLLLEEHPIQARDLILQKLPTIPEGEDRVGPLWALAQAQWRLEAWPQAEEALQQTIKSCPSPPSSESQAIVLEAAKNRLETIQEWKGKTFKVPLLRLVGRPDDTGVLHATLYVHSFLPQTIEVRFAGAGGKLVALTSKRQSRADSGVMVSVYDLSYMAEHLDDPLKAQVVARDKPNDGQEIELHTSQ